MTSIYFSNNIKLIITDKTFFVPFKAVGIKYCAVLKKVVRIGFKQTGFVKKNPIRSFVTKEKPRSVS